MILAFLAIILDWMKKNNVEWRPSNIVKTITLFILMAPPSIANINQWIKNGVSINPMPPRFVGTYTPEAYLVFLDTIALWVIALYSALNLLLLALCVLKSILEEADKDWKKTK